MDFIENDEFHIPDQVGTPVEHTSQDFRSHLEHMTRQLCHFRTTETHDQAGCFRVDLHISREDSHVFRSICRLEITELLV